MFNHQVNVYLAPGVTDLRKSINGLSILVEHQMVLDPFSGYLFGFCNRKQDTIKLLYWDRNGFCLWMKRLEKNRFRWLLGGVSSIKITHRELLWLLEGFSIPQKKAHKELRYKAIS